MNPAIETRDLTVSYGGLTALSKTTLSIEAGSITALLGVNGSGKSTFFKALIGAVRVDRGSIQIFGEPPEKSRRASAIGYLPQSESVDWSFPVSVHDVVMMGRFGHRPGLSRRPQAQDRKAVSEALDRVGLANLADRQIGQLSGGQRKRAFVARCIAQEARLLLLDEPFAGVDTVSQTMIIELLRELVEAGATALVSTHDLQALPQLADQAVLLRNEPIFQGSVAEALRPENLARAFGVDLNIGGEHS